jgi:hypothetical protein
MSPELTEKRQALSRAIQEAESQGLVGEARAALSTLASNPSLLASMAIEQIPLFVLSGGVGRGASAVGQIAARRAAAGGGEAAEQAILQAGQRAGQVGAVGTAAGLQGGSVAEQTYQDVMGLPAETIQRSPNYQELLRTMSPDDARTALAERAAREAGLLAGGISVGTMSVMPSAERAMFSRGVSQSAMRRALGVAVPEAASEAIEEGGGQAAQNLAVQRQADEERALGRGVGGAAATGAVLGGVMGAGVGVLQRPPEPPSTEPGAGNLPPELRGAIEDYVTSREPMTDGQNLLPREMRDIDTPVGNLSRSQLLRFMERSLPGMMQEDPEIASRMTYARSEDERLDAFREILQQRQAENVAERQGSEEGNIRRETATSPETQRAFEQANIQQRTGRKPVSEQELRRDLATAEDQVQRLLSARQESERRLQAIERAPTLDAAAREAVQAEIAQLDRLIAGRESVRRSIANSIPLTERQITAQENLRGQAAEAFDVAQARRARFAEQRRAPGLEIPSGTLAPDTMRQQTDDTRAGAPMLSDVRYVLNPEYANGRLVGGENVVEIGQADNFGNVLAYVERREGNFTRTVPVETTMDQLAQVPIRETSRMTQEAAGARIGPEQIAGRAGRGVDAEGQDFQPRRMVDRQGPEASARETGAEQTAAQAEVEPSPADARLSRRVEAQNKINALYLDKLKGMGAQGRLLRNALVQTLKDRSMSAQQVYAAFTAADTLAPLLPAGANHRVEFVKEILPTGELAGAIDRSGGNSASALQGLRIRPSDAGLDGLITISLAPDVMPYLGETAAHEAFHVLQDYYGKYDPQFKKLMDQGFRDRMMISDIDPTIRRKLEQSRYPGSSKSYFQVLTETLPNAIPSAREAQAYAFGSLLDASRRGTPMTGLKPAFARFVNFTKNFFSKLGSKLRGDGFQTVEEVLGRAGSEARTRFNQMATPTDRDAQATGPELSARNAPPFVRPALQLLEDAKATSSWRDWYDRHERQIEDLFGDDAPLFRQILSATSQAASVASNVSLALKAYEQLLNNRPFTGYLPAVIKNLDRIKADEALRGQKISQYGKANEAAAGAAGGVAVDRHIAQLMFGTDRPTKQMVQKATKAIQSISRLLGWQPREVQAALWAFNQIRGGVDPSNVKSYDFYLARKQEDIRALRSAVTRGEGGGIQASEAASGRTTEADAAARKKLTGSRTEASARTPIAPARGLSPTEAKTIAADTNKQYLQGLITAKERDAKIKEAGVRYSVVDLRTKSVVGSWPTSARARAEADKRNQQYGASVFSVRPEVQAAGEASARTPLASDPAFAAVRDKLTGKDLDKPNVFAAGLRRFTGALPGEKNSAALIRTSVNRAYGGWMLDRLVKEKGLSMKSVGLALEVALNNSGRIKTYIDDGPMGYDPKTGDVKVREDVPGLISAIKGRLNIADKKDAQAYLVALRERDLRKAGKQGFFNLTDAEVSQTISKAEAAHPEWREMAADIQRINKALLDFAVDTGTLDRSKADQLANMFYTPFYRQADEDAQKNANEVIGPRLSDSMTRVKTAFDVSLKGGENPLGDLFENMIRNADVVMKAGLKNVAMRQAAEAMEAVGLGRPAKEREAGKTITYRVDGQDKNFEVDDPVLYTTLAGAPRQITNGIYQTMANVAGFFRDMITLAPSFMTANLWRGKIIAYVQEGVPFYTNTFDGLRQALKSSASYKAIAAQTGFGGYTYGMGERDATEALNRAIAGVGYGPKGLLRRAYDTLQKVSEATEMAERIKLYERAKAQGMTDKEAAFQAYLLAPFSRRGMGGGLAGEFVNFFVPLVPFLNAKIQGMYRLIENEKGDTQKLWTLGIPKQMFLRGLVVMAASLALAAKNMEDEPERWDNENPDLKFRYDIIYMPGGNRILLPRAFEVGSVFGALPVFILDAIRRDDSRDLGKVLTDLGTSTFFFNPIPAAVVPLIGAATNYDFFRARALENASDQSKLPEERVNRSTSAVARFIGEQAGISPIRVQYVLEGYSGTIGANVLAGFDSILASAGLIPNRPSGAFGDPMSMPAIVAGLTGASRFYRSDDQSATRFVGDFYKIKEMTDQLIRSQNMATESRDLDRLAELRGEAGLPLRLRPMVNQASTQISAINRRIAMIERGDLDSVSKTEALRPLREQRDRIARSVVERARQMGAY